MKRRVLVTGANGFVGGYLCPHLAQNGYEVSCGVSGSPVQSFASRDFNLSDAASVDALVQWAAKPDIIVHLAAIAYIPEAAKSPAGVMDINLLGTIRVLEAVRNHTPGTRVLFVGSGDAYGRPERLPMTEDQPLRPVNPYAISKAAADHYCAYAAAAGLNIVRARPFNHGGAGQSDGVVLSSFAKQIAEMEAGTRPPVLHVGTLETIRDFSHVSDVVRAYRLLIERGKTGEAYNVCSGTSHRIQDLLDALLGMTKVRVEVRLDRERLRPVDIPEVRATHEKLTAETGWQPEIPAQKLVGELLDYWRAQNRA
jgi:GDP-4-dehydro-6-deoxy-D-mannose reductase